MRNAIAWSHDLLSPDEQVIFRRLSVFAGGCTLEAAAAVVSGPDERGARPARGDRVAGRQEPAAAGGAGRTATRGTSMLETIREFGLEQLAASGEEEATRRRLAAWCLALAEQSYREIWGPTQRQWLARLEAEHDNIRAVLAWALERGEAETAQRLAGELARFWWFRGHLTEGRSWAERALRMHQHDAAVARAKALGAAGRLASAQGDDERAVGALSGIRGDLSDSSGMPTSRRPCSGAWAWRRRTRATTTRRRRCLRRRSRCSGRWTTGSWRRRCATPSAWWPTNRATSRGRRRSSRRRCRSSGARSAVAMGYALASLGKVARAQGDYARAAALYAESLRCAGRGKEKSCASPVACAGWPASRR